jgi:hypothetical protein
MTDEMQNRFEDENIINITQDKIPNEVKEQYSFIYSNIPEINDQELKIVEINYINMQLVFEVSRLIRILKKHKKGDINNYITFSRFKKGPDKVMCDWCSIANGIFELLSSTILEVCKDKKTITSLYVPEHCTRAIKHFNNSISTEGWNHKHYSPLTYTDASIKPFLDVLNSHKSLLSDEEKENTIEKIKTILLVIDGLKQLEQRWCPFKHMKKLNFKRDYHLYNSHNDGDVESAMDLLNKEGKVTYKNILKYNYNNDKPIDDSTDYKKGITIFDDFMEYVEKIITT